MSLSYTNQQHIWALKTLFCKKETKHKVSTCWELNLPKQNFLKNCLSVCGCSETGNAWFEFEFATARLLGILSVILVIFTLEYYVHYGQSIVPSAEIPRQVLHVIASVHRNHRGHF